MSDRPYYYEHLPPDRAKAVEAWLTTPLNACRVCGEAVLPTDSRFHDERYVPLPAPEGETPGQRQERERPRVMHLACHAAEEAEVADQEAQASKKKRAD